MEIGGYFGLEQLIHKEYYPDLIPLNTGRNALAYLIRTKRIKKLYIPSFLCDSIYRVCEREGCQYEFYEIKENFQPVFSKKLGKEEWLYVVNYYGQVTNGRELKEKFGNIIFDNVQAFFQKPDIGVETIYSCRKFFGVPDGAYLATNVRLPSLEEDMSLDRMRHILGRYERTASEYYKDFLENEETYYELPVRKMSILSHNILGAIDYAEVKKKREYNFSVLYEYLQGKNGLEIKKVIGPYAYPFYLPNGMEIKKKLASQGVFIATLWPTAITHGGLAKEYSENILPLPCDQRYGYKNMKKVAEMILEYIR